MGQFFHLFANGDDARNFIISEQEMVAAFNRVGLCACLHGGVSILAFAIEESHPHLLLSGSYEECLAFKKDYDSITRHYIIANRGSLDDVLFDMDILEIDSEERLLNTAAYVIVQPTKDGKRVMPYDYHWGTGCLYFRPAGFPSIWRYDSRWELLPCRTFGSFKVREQHKITCSRHLLPDDWEICNGLILPSNYIDVTGFENIFRSYNRYRTFMSAGRNQLQTITDAMAMARGISIPDMEAHRIAKEKARELFGKADSRWLLPNQRLELARVLRNKYRLTFRQISTLSRLPESELRKYL